MWTGNIHWWNNHSNSDLFQSSKHSYLGFCPVMLHVHLQYSWSSCYILNLFIELFVALFMNDDYLPLYHGIPDVPWLFVIAIFTGDSPHAKEACAHLHPLRGYLSGRTDSWRQCCGPLVVPPSMESRSCQGTGTCTSLAIDEVSNWSLEWHKGDRHGMN